MNSDHPTAGDYAQADARAAKSRVMVLESRLERAEDHINYLGHIINALLENMYGDDTPENIAQIIRLASKNW